VAELTAEELKERKAGAPFGKRSKAQEHEDVLAKEKFQDVSPLAAAAARAAAARKKKAEAPVEEKKKSSLPAGLAKALARRKEKA